jgi:Domain of unknown function (DUF4337)
MPMNVEELQEKTEHAHHSGQKDIGITTTIVAVLLAVGNLLGHRAHTEEITLQTKVNDGWGFYQAKHNRAHEYGKFAENEALANQKDIAAKDLKISIAEECGVPAEPNCTSPVLKESPVLKQFTKENEGNDSPAHLAPAAAHEAGASGEENGGHEKVPKEKKKGAVDIQKETYELENEVALSGRQSDRYDSSELFLEISIVLCSIALLAEAKVYWKLSFLTTAAGVALMLWGWFLH